MNTVCLHNRYDWIRTSGDVLHLSDVYVCTCGSQPRSLAWAPLQCADMRMRVSAHTLSPDDWQRIEAVITELHAQGQVDRFARSHQAVFRQVHGQAAFFPFHRRFVIEFEDLGRQIDPEFTIPYWDTTLDARNPAPAPYCVTKPWAATAKAPMAAYSAGARMNPWTPAEIITSYIQTNNRLSRFRENIEFSIHGATHLGLGGDAATMFAPNDFFFFMHHANLDRLWWIWQNNQDAMFDYNGPGPNGEATLDDIIPQNRMLSFGGERVEDVMVLGYGNVCYIYDSAPRAPGSYPSQRNIDDFDESLPGRVIHGSEPVSRLPMFSGSSDLAGRGLEITRIHKALGENSDLQAFFPQVASMEPSRLEVAMAAGAGAATAAVSVGSSRAMGKCGQRKRIIYPARMSNAWIKMHGFDIERVEQVHREACRLIDLLNNSTYVSPY
ncbi:hypothetical protein BX661DRAFT_198952 [Kickxella alabastrina]|uniref:uncharacterized protein n=1 Tax=Kickxella alabastrina TaxID=61397 RepID=UPI0022207CA0|nr:uncharacterized protein BX661DRAFT_198952 [Kickxella alabastrina]KAI7826358.1 hypothetical protein BX661DRAFT_198952 [Kickxella alabastrina]